MRIVGLTGGIATGKSSVVSILLSNGVPVIDCDKIAFEAVKQVSNSEQVHILPDVIWLVERSLNNGNSWCYREGGDIEELSEPSALIFC